MAGADLGCLRHAGAKAAFRREETRRRLKGGSVREAFVQAAPSFEALIRPSLTRRPPSPAEREKDMRAAQALAPTLGRLRHGPFGDGTAFTEWRRRFRHRHRVRKTISFMAAP